MTLPYSPQSKVAFAHTRMAADHYGLIYVRAEDLLVALTMTEEKLTRQVLIELGFCTASVTNYFSSVYYYPPQRENRADMFRFSLIEHKAQFSAKWSVSGLVEPHHLLIALTHLRKVNVSQCILHHGVSPEDIKERIYLRKHDHALELVAAI